MDWKKVTETTMIEFPKTLSGQQEQIGGQSSERAQSEQGQMDPMKPCSYWENPDAKSKQRQK